MDTGSLGHFLPLSPISSGVSGLILTQFDTRTPSGSDSVIARTEFENSDRLPWKSGDTRTRTDTGSLGRLGRTQAASDVYGTFMASAHWYIYKQEVSRQTDMNTDVDFIRLGTRGWDMG